MAVTYETAGITIRVVQPNEMPTGNPHLVSGGNEFEVEVISDGTTTTVQLGYDGGIVGHGVARRRKGETRNPAVGIALATARALRDAADGYEEFAMEGLGEV
jgi:hypothetical protein